MKTSSELVSRYEKEIEGVLGCFDRLVVTGTLTEIAHPDAMDALLFREGFRAFDIGKFAEPLRQRIRDNVVKLAADAGVEIEYLSRSKGVRKEDLVAKVLARRGTHPGLVHIISVVESCSTFKPWRNPKTAQPGLRMQTGKCSTRKHGLIKKIAHSYRYYFSSLGCRLIIAAEKLNQYIGIPTLAFQSA
jgi:hypothetical protein